MKLNKIIYGILIGLMIFSSCSKDDDDSSPDSIIGVWKFLKSADVCSTEIEEVYNSNLCEQTGRTTFFEDGTSRLTEYGKDENENCILETDFSGTWVMNDKSLTFLVEAGLEIEFTFEISGNTLKLTFVEPGEPEPHICNGETPSSRYVEFERVE